ncbi:hypothetical protein EMCG_04537 [[Emmonsia] crescens]|uniref:Uncharacterized protein n=1 Tax=[Emmonsia] crescens TaxID=73230 RepID=A0A0G2J7C7_9EURO|nr:hypothetical protein EMCG_04537 [Emmonsia crescens UAMH 3008]
MKRNFAETFIEPEEETLARLGYHVDPAGKPMDISNSNFNFSFILNGGLSDIQSFFLGEFLPNWAPPASGAGLEAGNHVEVTYPVHIDPQLSASAGDTQQNQEPLFPDDDDHDDDTAAAQGVEFDRGFCRDSK